MNSTESHELHEDGFIVEALTPENSRDTIHGNGPHVIQEAKELRSAIASVLRSLPAREARVLELRYGLNDNEQHSYADIATEIGVSVSTVSKLERKALIRLKHPSRSRYLKAAGFVSAENSGLSDGKEYSLDGNVLAVLAAI